MRIYFETSAVNYLYDHIFNTEEYSSIKTRTLQLQKGRKWQISNITLWEIFQTKDRNRRLVLFDFARSLFYNHLISSVEEIIINYINSGCPINEKKYELISQSFLAKEWLKACDNSNYYFEPDRYQLEQRSEHLRRIGKYFNKTENGIYLNSYQEINEGTNKLDASFLKHIFSKLLYISGLEPNEETKNYIIYSMQIVLLILCYGISFDQPLLEQFWNKNKTTEPLERLEIAVNTFPDVFFRGPLANITKMMILQSGNKSRGMYFDALHSIYITYSDLFITEDKHFLKYRERNFNDPNTFKILQVKDLLLA